MFCMNLPKRSRHSVGIYSIIILEESHGNRKHFLGRSPLMPSTSQYFDILKDIVNKNESSKLFAAVK